jgi:hypothetical protein
MAGNTPMRTSTATTALLRRRHVLLLTVVLRGAVCVSFLLFAFRFLLEKVQLVEHTRE